MRAILWRSWSFVVAMATTSDHDPDGSPAVKTLAIME